MSRSAVRIRASALTFGDHYAPPARGSAAAAVLFCDWDNQLGYIEFYIGLGAIIFGLLFVLAVIVSEAVRPILEWSARRIGMCDAGQSEYVRGYAAKLASARRSERMKAVVQLQALNDSSAVPCLLKAMARYNSDPQFLERAVRTL